MQLFDSRDNEDEKEAEFRSIQEKDDEYDGEEFSKNYQVGKLHRNFHTLEHPSVRESHFDKNTSGITDSKTKSKLKDSKVVSGPVVIDPKDAETDPNK